MRYWKIVLITAVLTLTFGCKKKTTTGENGGNGGNGNGGNGIEWETVVEDTIGPEGDTLKADNLTIIIPAGTFLEDAVITIKKSDNYPLKDDRLETMESVYRVENFPEIHDTISVEFSFDPTLLPSEDSCLIYFEGKAFVSAEGGEIETGSPILSTVVDRINGKANVEFAPPTTDKKDGYQGRNFNLAVTIFSGFIATSLDGKFAVSFSPPVSLDYVENVINYLIEAKGKLEGYGFSFADRTSWPIEVHIVNNLGEKDGQFVQSKWGLNYSYIEYKPSLSGNNFKATIGHELFHLLQMCYGACGHYLGYDYLWLCEASSVWFEAKMLGNPDYVSPVFYNNRNFIHGPLETETQDHGYGASSFLTYLTDEYGNNFMLPIYEKVKSQSMGSRSGTKAIRDVLFDNGASIGDKFKGFSFDYITGTINHSTWPKPDYCEYWTITPTDTIKNYNIDITDLSAWNSIVKVNWVGDIPANTKLTILLSSGTNPAIIGAVYTSSSGGGPWELKGEFWEDSPYEIVNFGTGTNKCANVILGNYRGIYPYDEVFSAPLNIKFSTKEEEVIFPDPNLEAVIREAINKPTGPIYPSDLLVLTYLEVRESDISNLTGLEYCINLSGLILNHSQISDISPLSGLTKMEGLHLNYNQISDISPLSGMTKMTNLWLPYNQISNISALSGMTKMTYLHLHDNQISDISALSGMIKMTKLFLGKNQISDISALSGMTEIKEFHLRDNQISDIAPLVANTGLAEEDYLEMRENLLDHTEGSDDWNNVEILKSRGVTVYW